MRQTIRGIRRHRIKIGIGMAAATAAAVAATLGAPAAQAQEYYAEFPDWGTCNIQAVILMERAYDALSTECRKTDYGSYLLYITYK